MTGYQPATPYRAFTIDGQVYFECTGCLQEESKCSCKQEFAVTDCVFNQRDYE